MLTAGISVVSIDYRYICQSETEGIQPRVVGPLYDAARALQFVRSKAADWNIEKERIGAVGGSAGGASSLWLAFQSDLADPINSDPIARESTRLGCSAVINAQTKRTLYNEFLLPIVDYRSFFNILDLRSINSHGIEYP